MSKTHVWRKTKFIGLGNRVFDYMRKTAEGSGIKE
jgi:hypothetical protein